MMNHSTDSLAERLCNWRIAPPPNPEFRHQVWQRIGRRTTAGWPAYLRAHSAGWSVAAALVLVAAGFTGHVAAGVRARADREVLVVTYLVDLDPRVQALLKPGAP